MSQASFPIPTIFSKLSAAVKIAFFAEEAQYQPKVNGSCVDAYLYEEWETVNMTTCHCEVIPSFRQWQKNEFKKLGKS